MDQVQPNRDLSGLQEQLLVGVQQVLVPYHVIRYRLREGAGSRAQAGVTLYCLVNAYLIDGTQIVSNKGNKIIKLLLGRNRLIRGLELGLSGARKNQKVRIIISPEYGYGTQTDIALIPPNSKLIFQVDILDFSFTPMERMTDTDLYYEVYHFLDQSDRFLLRGREDEGLHALTMAYRFARKIKHYKCGILGKIRLKWANILYCRGQFQDSLLVLNGIDRHDDTIEDCLRLHIALLQAMGKKQELEKMVENAYQDYSDNNIRRICVNYYKEIENWEKLKKLPGYDFKKDRFVENKEKSEKDRSMHFRIFS